MSTPVALHQTGTPPPPGQTVKLVDVLKSAKRATELGLEVSFPCTVVAFDPDAMKVTITRDYIRERYTADGTAPVPVLKLEGVRIHHDGEGRTGGGYLTFPIKVGDKGRFVIQDRYTGTWGTAGTPAVPALKHTHRSPDGFFRPGLRDDSRKIPSFDNVAAVLEATLIKLGANATEAAALGTTLKAYIDGLKVYIDGLVLPVTGTSATGGAVTGTAGPALVSSPPVPNFLSSKVSIE